MRRLIYKSETCPVTVIETHEWIPRNCPDCNFPLGRGRDFSEGGGPLDGIFQVTCYKCGKNQNIPDVCGEKQPRIFICDGKGLLYNSYQDAKENKPYLDYTSAVDQPPAKLDFKTFHIFLNALEDYRAKIAQQSNFLKSTICEASFAEEVKMLEENLQDIEQASRLLKDLFWDTSFEKVQENEEEEP